LLLSLDLFPKGTFFSLTMVSQPASLSSCTQGAWCEHETSQDAKPLPTLTACTGAHKPEFPVRHCSIFVCMRNLPLRAGLHSPSIYPLMNCMNFQSCDLGGANGSRGCVWLVAR
jgi:hypothetical protein